MHHFYFCFAMRQVLKVKEKVRAKEKASEDRVVEADFIQKARAETRKAIPITQEKSRPEILTGAEAEAADKAKAKAKAKVNFSRRVTPIKARASPARARQKARTHLQVKSI